MTDTSRKRSRILLIAGGAIVATLVLQNYFLVQKVDRQQRSIESLTEELHRRTFMNPGDTVRAFDALNLESVRVVIEPAVRDRKTLLYVFTTWCHSCRDNMGPWNRLTGMLIGEKVHVVGVCLDSVYRMNQLRSEIPLAFATYSLGGDTVTPRAYKMSGVPMTILLTEQGTVIKVWVGLLDEKGTHAIVDSIRVPSIPTQSASTSADAGRRSFQ